MINKRKRSNTEEIDLPPPNKKIFNKDNYVSPSQLINYVLKDPLIDYLNYYKIYNIYDTPNAVNTVESSLFTKMIKNKGVEFEKTVIDYLDNFLITNNKNKIYKINDVESEKQSCYEETINALNNKEPIIYQGVLYNDSNMTYGIVDLIIRGDYIKTLFSSLEENIDENKYYIIDIKFSTIKLSHNKKFILNSGMIPFYKCQILLYTKALNKLLNQNVKIGFILGKNNFNELATIHYDTYDIKYNKILDDAINWIFRVRNEGSNWILLPKPSIPELYPNMCNKRDDNWHQIKKELADILKELTSIYYVSYENRLIGFSNGIFSYEDPNCNCKNLGINGVKSEIIDKIIKINSSDNTELIKPNKIIFNGDINWRKLKNNQLEFYLDYETTCNFDDINFIFMIGIGYLDTNNNWIFKNFLSKTSDIIDQEEMFKLFWEFINKTLIEMKKKEGIFIHWTHAEPSFYSKTCEKLFIMPNKKFLDLYKVFIKEPIVIKGALNYSLKTVAKAMYENGLIKTLWDSNSTCSNGLEVLYLANQYYFEGLKDYNFSDIIYYNEIDCKVLCEILQYLRLNH
jgi:hypothetical protein